MTLDWKIDKVLVLNGNFDAFVHESNKKTEFFELWYKGSMYAMPTMISKLLVKNFNCSLKSVSV